MGGTKTKDRAGVAYRQLAAEFEEAIRSGELKAGERLPPELSIVETKKLSRTTVRLAIKELEKNSLVRRRRGSGTYVSPNPGRAWPTRASFTEFVKLKAERMHREVLECRWETASDGLAVDLEIERSTEVLRFRRVDRLDGVPIAVDEGWVATPYAQRFDREDLAEFDFQAVWGRKQPEPIQRTAFELRADAVGKELAKLLEIRPGAPVLVERADFFTRAGGACKILTWYRHDQYSFRRVFLHDETVDAARGEASG